MKKSDRKLGMDRDITRRDFIHDSTWATIALAALGSSTAFGQATSPQSHYPPTRTGLRGSHPGSFDVAHQVATGSPDWRALPVSEALYDLVVVGGGLSGLAAAWYFRKQHGKDARILILENHDDFGGHARRNEFHQGERMRLAWGGVFNLEYGLFSDTVRDFLDDIGIDVERMKDRLDFSYGANGRNGPAIWFDEQTYGRNHLATGCSFRGGDLEVLAHRAMDFPLDEESRKSIERFASAGRDITAGMTDDEVHQLMHGTSYLDFLVNHGGLTEAAAELFVKTTDGYWGVSAHSLSVSECVGAGLPLAHLIGKGDSSRDDYDVVMFPDGNASVARMLVRALIPAVAGGESMDDIVTARFDYSRLDGPGSKIRLRLNSTAVNVAEKDGLVEVCYVLDGKAHKVRGGRAILACNHRIIPHVCPQLPEQQKEAQRYQVKRPLLLTNVLLRDSKAHDRLGISGAYCPGRMHGATWLCKGVNSADYRHDWNDDGPVAMMFWGTLQPRDRTMNIKDQHRDSRRQMMALEFADYEREVRLVLDGMLGEAGFDVKRDVLAVTVNRWPHGYAYDYLDLWDPDWPEGQAPHELARRPFGNIAIANADAGADAYTHVAIEQAWRAVNELPV